MFAVRKHSIDLRLAATACRAWVPRASAVLAGFASKSGGCGSGGLFTGSSLGDSQMLIQADCGGGGRGLEASVRQIFVRCSCWHKFSIVACGVGQTWCCADEQNLLN